MSTTFERINPTVVRSMPQYARTANLMDELAAHIEACYAEIDRLTELHDIGIKAIGQLGTDVDFWKQQQIDACVEANGLAVQCEQQEAEIDRLRANALEWVTVTEDPATLPKGIGAVVLVLVGEEWWHQASLGSMGDDRRWRLANGRWERLSVGDRWAKPTVEVQK
jgi:hypothetical protein